jgi:hypothetical protein
MIFSPCSREKEVTELLKQGGWPDACAPDLRAHVSECRTCAELVLVTAAFQSARADAASVAKLSSPGALWWRAQLRRRNAAVERVGKPILGAQIFALGVNLMLAIGFVAYQARHGVNWLSWLEQLPQAFTIRLQSLWSATLFDSGWSLMVVIPALATVALLSGVAVYLATERQ